MPKYSGRSGGDENLVINLTVSGQEAAERDVKSFVNTLNTMLKGAGKYNINEYFESTKASIDSVRESMRTFVHDMDNAGNAGDFLKSYNAYIAQFDGSLQEAVSHIKSTFGDEIAARFGTTFDQIISSAERVSPAIAEVFDAGKLRESFSSFTYISKELGADISKIFAAINNGDAGALAAEVDRLRDSLVEADYTIANLQQRIEELGDSAANQRLTAFEDTARRMAREFRSLLVTNGVGSDDIGKFQSYFREIENGTITVRDAFAKAKQELGNLFSTPINAGGLEEALTRIESKLEQVAEKSGNARQASGGGAVAGGLLESAEQGTAAAEKETAAIEALVQQKSGINALTEALTAVAISMQNSGEVATNAFDSINRLVESMTKLGEVDESKLSHVATIMSSLAGAAELKAGTASTDNLIRLVSSINNIGDGKGIQTLKSLATIDFTRLSNLKVSGATLTHLATELPKIADVSVAPLKELASIDWTNLSALKIPKANLDNLTSLVEKTGIKVDSTGFDSMQSAINKIGTSLDGLQENIRTTFDLSNAISQASELASQYAGVKAALDTAAVAAASSSAGGGRGGRAAADSPDELQRLINLYVQYYDALKRIENARNSNDPYNEAYFTDVARGIETLIASIEKENDSLREQANATQSVQRAMQSWMELVNRNQAKADNKTAEQYRKEAEMAREAESAIRKKNEAEAASIAKQAAEDEARALQEVISQYEKYYDLEAKRINAESSGQTQVATYYRDQATAVKELINSIETLLPDLADQARRSSEVASAISGYNLAVAKSGSAEEQKNVKALIDLYVKLYAARTDVAKAYAAGGNNEATEIARQRAAAIKAEIDAIVGENAELDKQAQANTRVADAIYKHNAAINALNTDKIKQESAEIEKYKQQLDSLSQLNITGKNAIQFAGDETSVERYKAALAELQARFDAIGVASKDTRAQAVADFDAQRQKVEELRKSLNQAAKDQSAASNLANKIELYASKNGAAPLAMRQQWQQWISELRNGDAVARGTVSSIDAEFKRLQNTIRTTSAGGKTFFQQMKEGWSKFGGWSLVTRSFTKVISIMKQAVTAVKEVDSAMTELRKVTDATAAGYDRFYKSATETASSVGAKLSDVINASADFARLGFSIEDASELARAAMLYTNIGDGITDVSVATESIISTMKAFDIEASDAMSIVDKFNEVGKELLPMPVATRCLAECYIGQSSVVKCA